MRLKYGGRERELFLQLPTKMVKVRISKARYRDPESDQIVVRYKAITGNKQIVKDTFAALKQAVMARLHDAWDDTDVT